MSRRRTPTVSPSLSQRLDVVALILTTLIVLTGAAVRLTGSGLGCSDWPECSVGHLTPALQFHGLVEFGNRLVTVVLTVAVAAAFLGSIFRSPRRRDLVWLSGGLVAGVLAQAVLGGIVVYTKLNPYVVMVHFYATMLLLVDAVVLVHRSSRDLHARDRVVSSCPGRSSGSTTACWCCSHSSSAPAPPPPAPAPTPATARASRWPGGSRSRCATWPSSTRACALLLIGVTIGLVVALHMGEVPERVRRSARILMTVMVAQAAVGYTQYFTHLPALLVEVHILGATALVIGAVQTFLACTYHAPEALDVPLVRDTPATGVPIGAH